MKLCFIDLETTGTSPEKHGILQIAGQLHIGIRRECFRLRVRPFHSDIIEAEAMKLHGLNPEEGAGPKDAHTELIRILSQYVDRYDKRDKFYFLAYNAHFDNTFLRKFFEKCGDKYFGSWFWFPYIDVMTLALTRLLDRRPGMENFKLASACRALGVEFDMERAHGAEYDIQKTVELWEKLNLCSTNGTPGTASISTQP